MKVGKIASSAKYRIDKQFKNCQFFSQDLVFQSEKISEIG